MLTTAFKDVTFQRCWKKIALFALAHSDRNNNVLPFGRKQLMFKFQIYLSLVLAFKLDSNYAVEFRRLLKTTNVQYSGKNEN